MKNTISDTKFVNTLPMEIVLLIELNPAKWAYAMNKNRVLRREMKYRGEAMQAATFAELTLTDFGCLLDGSLEMPRDFDYSVPTTINGVRPRAAWYSGNIWPPHANGDTTLLGQAQ
ncbi:MAG: hypothetical protein ACERLB_13420 [Gammaproteobacteria bacterium]